MPRTRYFDPGCDRAGDRWCRRILQGELDMTIIFPGLRCDMVLLVASIGSEGLLGTEALQSCLPHQLDIRTGQLWADGHLTLQLHQQ